MRRLMVFLFLLIMGASAQAQDETLISGKIESGGFGGPVLKITEINDETGIMVGGRGGWIINHTFVIGGGGYGLANDIKAKDVISVQKLYLDMGYGGLEMEYIINSSRLIHLSFHTLIGAGGINYEGRGGRFDYNDDSDAFFVAEPGANVTLNVTQFLRVGVGASYRYVNGVDLIGLNDSDLDGASANLTLKFGKF